MVFNPVIIVAIIAQSFISKFSRIAGAIAGFVITSGILIWGLSVYAEGYEIAFFGIPLTMPIFLVGCLVWFGFDTKEFISAKKESTANAQALESPLLQDDRVVRFYQTTLSAWASGKLSKLNAGFEGEGKIAYEEFVKKYPPAEGGSLCAFFRDFSPVEGEFMVGVGDSEDVGPNRSWFLLTNLRLIQKDGRDNVFKEIKFADVDSFKTKGTWKKGLVFKMKSGAEIDFEKVDIFPDEKFLSAVKDGLS